LGDIFKISADLKFFSALHLYTNKTIPFKMYTVIVLERHSLTYNVCSRRKIVDLRTRKRNRYLK